MLPPTGTDDQSIFFAEPLDLNTLCLLELELFNASTANQRTASNQDNLFDCSSKQNALSDISARPGSLTQVPNSSKSNKHVVDDQRSLTQVPTNQRTVKSTAHQPHVIKCREFIFTEPDIIGSPSFDDELIKLIMKQSLYKSGRIQSRCAKQSIKVSQPKRVTSREFEECLRYTLLARLAPNWNKVGEFLIKGRDFLTNNGPLDAICLDVNVCDTDVTFALKPHSARLAAIKLSDMEVARPVLNEFFSTDANQARIREYSISNRWCCVLPSMKKGQIVNVTRKIPTDSPFKSYKDMKKYWKNTYGYRLPESDADLLFYQIYFKLLGNTLFTYPETCVRPRPLQLLPRPDADRLLAEFLADLRMRVPSVCGERLSVREHVYRPQRALSAVTDLHNDLHSDTRHAAGTCATRGEQHGGKESVPPNLSVVVRSGSTNISQRMNPILFTPSQRSNQNRQVNTPVTSLPGSMFQPATPTRTDNKASTNYSNYGQSTDLFINKKALTPLANHATRSTGSSLSQAQPVFSSINTSVTLTPQCFKSNNVRSRATALVTPRSVTSNKSVAASYAPDENTATEFQFQPKFAMSSSDQSATERCASPNTQLDKWPPHLWPPETAEDLTTEDSTTIQEMNDFKLSDQENQLKSSTLQELEGCDETILTNTQTTTSSYTTNDVNKSADQSDPIMAALSQRDVSMVNGAKESEVVRRKLNKEQTINYDNIVELPLDVGSTDRRLLEMSSEGWLLDTSHNSPAVTGTQLTQSERHQPQQPSQKRVVPVFKPVAKRPCFSTSRLTSTQRMRAPGTFPRPAAPAFLLHSSQPAVRQSFSHAELADDDYVGSSQKPRPPSQKSRPPLPRDVLGGVSLLTSATVRSKVKTACVVGAAARGVVSSNTARKSTDEKRGEKSTPKQQIQTDICVESYVRNNQLHKVNVATLVAWLRERGVACKSRDKKEQLIARANLLLSANYKPEP